MDFDWSRFRVKIPVKADLETLYRCWSTRGGMERWFLRACEYRRPDGTLLKDDEPVSGGDTYKWHWHGYSDEDTEHGTILETNGKDLFRFSFGKAGNCTVRLYEEEGEHIVELVQENIPTDETGKVYYHMGCKNGWTFHMTDMKSILEGGVDLRNRNLNLKGVANS